MQAIKHFAAGEEALRIARAEVQAAQFAKEPTVRQVSVDRAALWAQIAEAEFAGARAAAVLAGPYRDPLMDAEAELPSAKQAAPGRVHMGDGVHMGGGMRSLGGIKPDGGWK